VRTPHGHRSVLSVLIGLLICMVGLGILAAPSPGRAQNGGLTGGVVRGAHMLPVAAARPVASQDPGQAAVPAAPKPVELPEGDGKAIATENCQACHKLTNLTKAHKSLDEWKDTVQTMMDRGANVPADKVDTLVQYLAKNFGPQSGAPAESANAAPAAPASTAPAPPKPVELPDGEGKAIATENCQACHKLTNLTKAHKSLDEWKDTVQTMIDRGANVPADKLDTLVQYLAKNFGPKDSSAPASGPSGTSTQSQ
jgi:mono/diheme cytochrome c family protein